MTRESLPAQPDDGPEWSAWLMLAAVVVAALALLGPGPANGATLLAVVLAVLSIARRVVESHKRATALDPETETP